jgi:hypothetical protein
MAKLLVRALQLPATDIDYFSDDDGSPYEEAINAIAALGITNGCGPQRYCPQETVSRAEVAAFLSRSLRLPDAATDHFVDDAASSFHEEVNALAEAGLTHGCGVGLYCPDAAVSRSQAASFIARAMELAERSPAVPDASPPTGSRTGVRSVRFL